MADCSLYLQPGYLSEGDWVKAGVRVRVRAGVRARVWTLLD